MIKIVRTVPSDFEFKPTPIPAGFKLIVDTNEQIPLFQSPVYRNIIIKKQLRDKGEQYSKGDYSVKGFENQIIIERKQISDFLSYIGSEREKTIKKLMLVKDFYFKALIIEASDKELTFELPAYTQLTLECVRGFLKTIRVKYGFHVFNSDSRDELERFVLDHLTYAYKQLRKGKLN